MSTEPAEDFVPLSDEQYADQEVALTAMHGAPVWSFGPRVPVSAELLEDAPDLFGIIQSQMSAVVNDRYFMDRFAYGLHPTNHNFMPWFAPFPRIERAQRHLSRAGRRLRRTYGRFSDAVEAFKHGIPEPDDY